MEHENLKIKTFERQIVQMVNASGLPVSVLYYMFNGITKDLENLFEEAIEKDKIDLTNNSQSTEEIPVEIVTEEKEDNK